MSSTDPALGRASDELRTVRGATESITDHREFLWGLCYRMTGSAADADDLVQETFVRALEHPPADRSLPWRPWLTRVAINLARDLLRRRKRREYPGTWLPTPVETGHAEGDLVSTLGMEDTPEARYSSVESASFAFLMAMEALTTTQRAVLLLRDVMDLSVRETATSLEMSEVNVKTTLHRARRAMAAYHETRVPPDRSLAVRLEEMLKRLMVSFATGDVAAAQALLASDVRAFSDGGGATFASKAPVVGANKVARMYVKLATRSSTSIRAEIRGINGQPALVVDDPDALSPNAKRSVIAIELDRDGRVRAIHSVLAPVKLKGIAPIAA